MRLWIGHRLDLLLILGLVPIFLAEAIFWSLWDQPGSAWACSWRGFRS